MRKTRGARFNAVSQPLAGSLASLRFTSNLATSIATMSSDSYTGPPSQKRFRSENGLPIDSRLSEAPNGYEEASSETLRADFGPSQFGHLDGLGEKEDCVAEGGRHFCPPHYATSAAGESFVLLTLTPSESLAPSRCGLTLPAPCCDYRYNYSRSNMQAM